MKLEFHDPSGALEVTQPFAPRLDTLEEEHDRLKQERGEIRDRIENILASLEALEQDK